MSSDLRLTVQDHHTGERLDKVLSDVLPDSGLRLRRRLCDQGQVFVDDRPRRPGFKVAAGQTVIVNMEDTHVSADSLGLAIIQSVGMFSAINKPGRVHSAAIVGKQEGTVEGCLPDLFPGDSPILLNRLDYLTSGIVMVALDPDGQAAYLAMEKSGDIRKFYVATVKGRLDGVVTIKKQLDTDDRKVSRVLEEDDPDSLRWTDVEVLSHDHENDTTQVRCLIQKGARHQIRAHLASIGHPIVGDPLYGDGEEGDSLALKHQQIEFPGFSAAI